MKIMEILPYVKGGNTQSKRILLKILPVVLCSTNTSDGLALIAKIKRHPAFIEEKSLLNGWETRFKKLSGYEWTNKTEVCNHVHIPGIDSNDVIIGYGDIELFLRFNRWLKFNKLHKYLYFFGNLKYGEINTICDEQSIKFLEQKVDLHELTNGGRNAILRKLMELNQREARLMVFSKMSYYSNVSKVERAIFELKAILKTPIRRNSVIPCLLVKAIETVVHAALKLSRKEFMQVHQAAMSLLKLAWGSYFFQVGVKNKLNTWQYFLNSKKKSFSYSKKIYPDRDVYAIHFDVEIGIKSITAYLEQFILQDDE